jgi:hypothetical protein
MPKTDKVTVTMIMQPDGQVATDIQMSLQIFNPRGALLATIETVANALVAGGCDAEGCENCERTRALGNKFLAEIKSEHDRHASDQHSTRH